MLTTMAWIHTWLAISLSLRIKALSIERDTCSNIQCKASDCDGTNEFLPDGRGICFEGPCSGLPCLSVCPSAEISCNQFDCAALYGGNDTAWTCSSGDYGGCPCQESCPSELPKCSDPACKGSSNLNDEYGICGASLLSDCPCINSCPSILSSCSADDCLGLNNPSGADSVCIDGINLGCPCKSSCPAEVACNDAQCQGYNNADDPTNSYCTAGSHVGCRCKSTCGVTTIAGIFGRNRCTADGCNGINNLNGKEFCTSGDFRGCQCDSNCPAALPACSDSVECDGFEGICTIGKASGCACTGSLTSKKRWPVRNIFGRTGNPNYEIPCAYYLCGPRAQPGVLLDPNTRAYPRQQIALALRRGHDLSISEEQIVAGNQRRYPTRFYIREGQSANFAIPDNHHISTNRLVEFPIIRDDAGNYVPFVADGDQGPDRVVFDGMTGRFAGIFTHRGEVNNGFHRCVGNQQDLNNPSIGYDFGPTIMDANPFGWFSGGGGGSLPMKRKPTLPAPNFPTTLNGCPTADGQCYCFNEVSSLGWYPRDAALQAIDQACGEWSGQKVPISRSPTDIATLDMSKQVSYENTQWSIEMSVWQTLLVGSPGSTVDQQNCIAALRGAMDNCQTDTGSKKIGGQYIFHIDGVGTQQFTIHPGKDNPAPTVNSGQEPFNL